MDHVPAVSFEKDLQIAEEILVRDECRCRQAGTVGFAIEFFLYSTKVASRDRIADKQYTRQIVLVGISDPNIGPFDPFENRFVLRAFFLSEG